MTIQKRNKVKKSSAQYKQINDAEAKVILERAKAEYLKVCGGYESFFDFLQKAYSMNPVYWVRTARKCGYDIIKKGNNFYLKIEMNDTERD